MAWDLPDTISIRDVGPRDGLQPELPVTVADRLGLIAALVDAGVHDVEAAAFVSPRAVPAMAGAGDLFRAIERDEHVRYWALVPNLKGAELAVEAGVDGLTVTVSASETYSQKNVKMSVEDSVAQIGPIAEVAGGNLATEDLVHLCDGLGLDTGIDLDRMIRTAQTVSALIGRNVPSRLTATLGR